MGHYDDLYEFYKNKPNPLCCPKSKLKESDFINRFQTNDDWRKTCSTEEFAKWVYDLIMHKGNTEWYEDLLDYREDIMEYRADYHLIEMWLKEKHKHELSNV